MKREGDTTTRSEKAYSFPKTGFEEISGDVREPDFGTVSALGGWHRKWIDYRFLAERLRAAMFLFIAGTPCDPPIAIGHEGVGGMVFAVVVSPRDQTNTPKPPALVLCLDFLSLL